MIQPVIAEVIERSGVDRHGFDFTCSGSSDYLAGQPFSFVMTLDAVGGVAADLGVPRRDGRRLGAVRGLGQDPDRPRRHGAGLQLRQVVAR